MTSPSKVSLSQMETLLLFMEQHPVLVHGKVAGPIDRSFNNHLWQTLSNVLNSDRNGPVKPPLKWQKSWIDWKSNTKKKYMKIKNHHKESNGGTPCPYSLSKIEEKLIAFLYPESFEEDVLLAEAILQTHEHDIQNDGEEGKAQNARRMDVGVKVVENDRGSCPSMNQVTLLSQERQQILTEDLVETTFKGNEKTVDDAERLLDLEERKLLLKERTLRDKERRTEIFEKAVSNRKRKYEIYDRAVQDRERRTDIYARVVRDKGRQIELLSRIVRDVEKRTQILNQTSTAIVTAITAYTRSVSK